MLSCSVEILTNVVSKDLSSTFFWHNWLLSSHAITCRVLEGQGVRNWVRLNTIRGQGIVQEVKWLKCQRREGQHKKKGKGKLKGPGDFTLDIVFECNSLGYIYCE